MRISTKDWKNYIEKLSKLNNTAGEKMSDYVARHGFNDPNIIDYAYGLVTKYGEGSASLSAMMYDAIAEMEGKILPSAEVAETPEYGEVAKAINGVKKHSQNPNSYGNVVNRLVKRTGADTMLKNADRDGAEFAWIPSGDTCAFCIALASRGWQHISKKSLKNGHAEHIHANCDCNYTVRFDGKSTVEGYDPDEYLEIYENAEGSTPDEKINSMRAKYRAENRDKINAQKRANYLENKRLINGIPKSWELLGDVSEDEILKGVNPKFNYNLPLYLHGTNDDYTNNCTNCTVTYTQRKKGYNVTACSVGECGKLRSNDELFTAWKGREPIISTSLNFQEVYDYCNSLENGAIVAIAYGFPQLPFIQIPGHAMVVEKRNNKVIFVDCQVGKTYNLDMIKDKEINRLAYMRVDDLELSDRGVSACKQVKS